MPFGLIAAMPFGLIAAMFFGLIAAMPFGLIAAIPFGLRAAMPFGLIAAIPFGLIAAIPFGLIAAMPFGLIAAMPFGLIAAMPFGLIAAMPFGLIAAIPFGLIAAMPFGLIAAIPFGLIAAMPFGLIAAMPFGLIAAMPFGLIAAIPFGLIAAIPFGLIAAMPFGLIDAIPFGLIDAISFGLRAAISWTVIFDTSIEPDGRTVFAGDVLVVGLTNFRAICASSSPRGDVRFGRFDGSNSKGRARTARSGVFPIFRLGEGDPGRFWVTLCGEFRTFCSGGFYTRSDCPHFAEGRSRMRVSCNADDQVTGAVLAVGDGSLDVHGATHFWEAVNPHLTKESPHLLVDMSGVDLMTSAGIGVLIRLLNHCEPLGGTMALFGTNPKVLRVLQICELESVLNSCETLDEAREKLSR